MARVELENVSKVFRGAIAAVDNLSLTVEDGELVVLVGPSGCGKSTTLRLIAGLDDVTSGDIRIGGRVVTELSPKHRDVAMVFQHAATFPFLTVAENIGFGLKMRRRPRTEIHRKVKEVAALLGLQDLLARRPAELSGGERQRVAIGRAMLRDPQVFLMDEPLSSLDARLRLQMRGQIARLQRRLGTTTLYVTHDQQEAMTLGDRVAVLNKGVLEQFATPDALYGQPATLFVATFIGSPPMNVMEARVGDGCVTFGGVSVPVSSLDRGGLRDGETFVGIRPADLSVSPGWRSTERLPALDAVVESVENLGDELHANFTISTAGRWHDSEWNSTGDGLFTAYVDVAHRPRAGAQVQVCFRPDRLYIFDRETTRILSHPRPRGAE